MACLEPGETQSTTFNLFEWYLPASPGEYKLIAYYQADEELMELPDDIVWGVFASQPASWTGYSVTIVEMLSVKNKSINRAYL
ncbi:MAG: hypothetical protein QNL62_20765 [Gammaproteobacteria bacterium]|nr:hypothetical protein [Gammaproteobacteria bacterium]